MIIKGYFFLFLHENVCCGYLLESPRRGNSNEYQQHMFFKCGKLSLNYPQIPSLSSLLDSLNNLFFPRLMMIPFVSGSSCFRVLFIGRYILLPYETYLGNEIKHDGELLYMVMILSVRANNVDPDRTAPSTASSSGSTLSFPLPHCTVNPHCSNFKIITAFSFSEVAIVWIVLVVHVFSFKNCFFNA